MITILKNSKLLRHFEVLDCTIKISYSAWLYLIIRKAIRIFIFNFFCWRVIISTHRYSKPERNIYANVVSFIKQIVKRRFWQKSLIQNVLDTPKLIILTLFSYFVYMVSSVTICYMKNMTLHEQAHWKGYLTSNNFQS